MHTVADAAACCWCRHCTSSSISTTKDVLPWWITRPLSCRWQGSTTTVSGKLLYILFLLCKLACALYGLSATLARLNVNDAELITLGYELKDCSSLLTDNWQPRSISTLWQHCPRHRHTDRASKERAPFQLISCWLDYQRFISIALHDLPMTFRWWVRFTEPNWLRARQTYVPESSNVMFSNRNV